MTLWPLLDRRQAFAPREPVVQSNSLICDIVGIPGSALPTQASWKPLWLRYESKMTKVTESQCIERTAEQVAAELAQRGIEPDRPVTITIEPEDDWLAQERRFSRQEGNLGGLVGRRYRSVHQARNTK